MNTKSESANIMNTIIELVRLLSRQWNDLADRDSVMGVVIVGSAGVRILSLSEAPAMSGRIPDACLPFESYLALVPRAQVRGLASAILGIVEARVVRIQLRSIEFEAIIIDTDAKAVTCVDADGYGTAG